MAIARLSTACRPAAAASPASLAARLARSPRQVSKSAELLCSGPCRSFAYTELCLGIFGILAGKVPRQSGSVAHTSCLQGTSVPWQGSPKEDILAAWRKQRQVRGSLPMNLPPVSSSHRTANGAGQQALAGACACACAAARTDPNAINSQQLAC